MSDYQNIKVKKLENSEMEIEGEISVEKVEAHIDEAMRRLGEEVAMPGFRKGHVPPKILKQRLGEMAVWTEAAEYALRAEYPTILKAALEKVKDAEPISAPEVTITKMAPGNPLGFKMRIALMPEVKLPDYKKIARERTKD
ncbi:MAG: trigger factor family protein, partial [Candidatus Wolfebacteria bacterium]|nr:trigger factor family protein [Candidatus Wolfebacteria bacterium]